MPDPFRVIAVVGALLLASTATARSQSSTGFDDLGGSGVISNGYSGLNWNNFHYLDATTVPNTGYANGLVSTPNVAYNAFGNAAEFTGSLFTFNSAYFTAAWNDGLNVNVFGFRGGLQVFTQSLVLNTAGPLLATFNWVDVDRVRFESSGGVVNAAYSGSGTHFAMDDLMVNGQVIDPGTVTPEPMSMMLLGTGLAGVGAMRRRRRREVVSA